MTNRLMDLATKFEKYAQAEWLEQYMREQEGRKGPARATTPEEQLERADIPAYNVVITSNSPRVMYRTVYGVLGPNSMVSQYFFKLIAPTVRNPQSVLGEAISEMRLPQTRAAFVRAYGEKEGSRVYDKYKTMLETSGSQHQVFVPTSPATPTSATPEAPEEFAAGYQAEAKKHHDKMMKLAKRLGGDDATDMMKLAERLNRR